MQRRFEITSDLYISRSSLSTKFISHSVICNENLSYKHRYAAFVNHFRSHFFFFFISALPAPVVSILNEILLREEVSQELKLRPHAAIQGMSNCVQKRMENYSVRMYEEKI